MSSFVPGVELAAAVARIDERAKADARQVARPVRGDVAEEMRDDALRQIVGLDLVGDRQVLQLWHEAPMTADNSAHQAFVRKVIEAALLAIALTGGIDEGQISGVAGRRSFGVARSKETLLDRDRDLLGKADADETAGRQCVAVADQLYRVAGRNDLALFVALE